MKNTRSLFSRLFWSVALSEFLIFLLVGYFSYTNVRQVLIQHSEDQNIALESEISGLLQFQDFSLGVIERNLDQRLKLASWKLSELIFMEDDSISSADLSRLMQDLNLDPESEYINVLDSAGLVVNSSWLGNKGLAIDDFDDVNFNVGDMLSERRYYSAGFEMDPNTRILHKWAYQSNRSQNHLFQIGAISKEGSRVSKEVGKIIQNISQNRPWLVSIEIYMNARNPFSFSSNEEISEEEENIIKGVFKDGFSRRQELEEEERNVLNEYLYSQREASNFNSSVVVFIKKDLSVEEKHLRYTLYRKMGLFAVGLTLLFVVLFLNTKLITGPIQSVSSASKSLGEGDLSKRVPVLGNREVKDLAKSFNQMANDLQKSDQKIREQKAKIEEAHKNIQDSIIYAKRIQAAILPPQRMIDQHMPDSFVLYRPKDIVAGDFYWLDELHGVLLFAAADCTGHGVPGAMISVICHSALNRSVKEYGLTDPALILGKTRDIVLQEFDKSDDEVQDGMDIALCAISNYTLWFSGAQRSAYIIRDGKVLEVKGDRQPVGMYHRSEAFTTKTVELMKGDSIYLFTDGITDQFGGEEMKKFLPQRLKALLLAIQDVPIREQKSKIEEAFDDWRGAEEQIDDVCVIGLKIN